jgi:hypothetical protein
MADFQTWSEGWRTCGEERLHTYSCRGSPSMRHALWPFMLSGKRVLRRRRARGMATPRDGPHPSR